MMHLFCSTYWLKQVSVVVVVVDLLWFALCRWTCKVTGRQTICKTHWWPSVTERISCSMMRIKEKTSTPSPGCNRQRNYYFYKRITFMCLVFTVNVRKQWKKSRNVPESNKRSHETWSLLTLGNVAWEMSQTMNKMRCCFNPTCFLMDDWVYTHSMSS